MPFARIWYEPSGAVKITTFVDGADPGTVARVLIQDGHVHQASTFEDYESEPELLAKLPADRSQRAKWRKDVLNGGVMIDLTVPDPPHPKQALLNAVDQAKTIADLKTILTDAIRAGAV